MEAAPHLQDGAEDGEQQVFFCPVLLMSVVEEIACEVKTKEQEHDQKGRTDNR